MIGKSMFVAGGFLSAFLMSFTGEVNAQSYPVHQPQAVQHHASGCNSGCDSQNFGYPSNGYSQGHAQGCGGGCGGGCLSGGGGAFADYQQKWDKFKANFNLQTARNSAWPQPFMCRDRSIYFQTMQTQIDAGWVNACTLTDTHFDNETNKLNTAGESKLATMMQTVPEHRRQIFVYQSNDEIDSRIAAVKSTVDRWYGQLGKVSIAATQIKPQASDGQYIDTINERFIEAMPIPVLNAAIGGGVQDQ